MNETTKNRAVSWGPGDPIELQEERLKNLHRIYEECGTLKEAGKRLGITGERARQLLIKGAKAKLFKYLPVKKYLNLSRSKLIKELENWKGFSHFSEKTGIGHGQFLSLCRRHHISHKERREYLRNSRRRMMIERYKTFVKKLGHHPSSTEMLKKPGFSLTSIYNFWDSINDFRRDVGIPKPPYLSPGRKAFWTAFRRKRLREKKRKIEKIMRLLRTKGVLPRLEIDAACGWGMQTSQELLKDLLERGFILRERVSQRVYYSLSPRSVVSIPLQDSPRPPRP